MLGFLVCIVKIVSIIITKQSLEDIGEKNKIRVFFTNMNNNLNLEFFANFMDATQLDIYMSCFLNI